MNTYTAKVSLLEPNEVETREEALESWDEGVLVGSDHLDAEPLKAKDGTPVPQEAIMTDADSALTPLYTLSASPWWSCSEPDILSASG